MLETNLTLTDNKYFSVIKSYTTKTFLQWTGNEFMWKIGFEIFIRIKLLGSRT